MNRGELFRSRRCRLLVLAMLFGVLLPIFSRSWISLGAALAGESLLGAVWWRECRGSREDRLESRPGSCSRRGAS